MKKYSLRISTLLLLLLIIVHAAWAEAAPAAVLSKVRFSQTPEKVRVVFDLDKLPAYSVTLSQDASKLIVDLGNTTDQTGVPQIRMNDVSVSGITLSTDKQGLKAIINLKTAVNYKVFTLASPNRLIVDILKNYDNKVDQQIAPGVKFTTWLRGRPEGPVAAYILDLDPASGYSLKPALSNDAIVGLETVKSMSDRSQAFAAINGSYFALDGQILGLSKMNGTIISTAGLARTSAGIMPDGKVIIGQADYDGVVELPDGQKVSVAGVNCDRGPDSLVIYNRYYDTNTDTNEYGNEYVVQNGTVTSINQSNTAIPDDGVVLSVHGAAAQTLAGVKVGDKVKISQTLGTLWDQAVQIIGAGPTLVKNGSAYITAKMEEFPSDITVGRAPRTALGVTKNGHLLLVAVDGRQQYSIGFSLLELAMFMQELGAVDAMNLDGGGSTEMVVQGNVVNKPSDGNERRVGNAWIVVPKAQGKLAN